MRKPEIVLGIAGGISAYKAVALTRLMIKERWNVTVCMTKNACRFMGPLTFQTLTNRNVITEMYESSFLPAAQHVHLADLADLVVVAPATANIIGKFSCGIADDFLSSLFIAIDCPALLAPAMNTRMWNQRVVRENIRVLKSRGVCLAGPVSGDLACGTAGQGKMAEPEEILQAAADILSMKKDLKGVAVLITAGPTREPIDPVRFISNPSTGRMGFALAAEASSRGAEVMLVAGPTSVPPPRVSEMIRVTTAVEMESAVNERIGKSDVMIAAAAVSDYRPEIYSAEKIRKSDRNETIAFTRTPDILISARKRAKAKTVFVGFAAETSDLVQRAGEKLERKNLNLIVANDITEKDAGFEAETNRATLIDRDSVSELPLMQKTELAREILDRISIILDDLRS